MSFLEVLPTDSPTLANLKRSASAKLAQLPAEPSERARVLGSKVDFFAASSLRIRPKETEGGLGPFVFNPIQMDYLAGLRRLFRLKAGVDLFTGVRDIILKPRQMGFTTFEAGIYFFDALFRPGRNTLVLTHLDKVSQKVLEIYRAFYDSLPPEIKATVRLRRASALHLELEFLGPDGLPDPIRMPPSSFIVHTAAGLDLRGLTIHNLHCSEAAFYDNWVELVRGVFQAVPSTGNIVLESTANGFNHFKDLVDAALVGKGIWRLIFYPWFAHSEYSLALSREEAERIEATLEQDERRLMLEARLTLGQIGWRRAKISEMGGSVDSFRQEYPASIPDAFLSSGRPVFPAAIVSKNLEASRAVTPLRVEDLGVGKLIVWEDPRPGADYVGSADPAEGIDKGEGDIGAEIGGTDFSSFSIQDARTLRTVAALHGHFDPADFARRIAALGLHYNEALIVVERNNHGHLVLYVLEEAAYPNLYRHLEYDVAGQAFLKLGFPMTPVTRPLVVDTLREVVVRDALPCPDPGFWREALVFVWNPAGKQEAMPTRHDDRIMEKAIGVYVLTLGAKAWGGSGLLHGADDAGLPLPGAHAGLGATEAAPLAPAVPLTVSLPPPPSILPVAVPPAPPAGTEAAPHPAMAAAAQMRAEARASDSPRCGNCVHRKEVMDRLVCGAPGCGWTIRDQDPPCPVWEPVPESYTENVVRRMNIGGVE